MALIIKGNMPDACWDCDYRCGLNILGTGQKKHECCPIIGEIPDKHGRLIDEAKLRERAYAIQIRDRISFTDALAMALIEAETIVEARK